MKPLICPYCGGEAPLDHSTKVYQGRDYGLMYICENYPQCDAYVGVHQESGKPLGRLANKELRLWRGKAHSAFDELWKRKLAKRRKERGNSYPKYRARGSGYKWLREQLGIEAQDCHIGMFDVDMCKRVIQVCEPYLIKRG